MLYLKGCPRCHGDLYLDRDAHGAFRQCLQCGWIQDLREAPPMAAARVAIPAPRQAAASSKPSQKAVA